MARYEVTGPDGRRFEVTAPEGASEEDLFSYVQQTYYAAQPQKPKAEPTVGGQIKEAFKGIAPGAVGLVESAAVGASALLPDEYEADVRRKIKEVAEAAKRPFAPEAGYEETVGRKFGEAVGSTVPFFALGPAGLAGRAAAMGLGVGAGAGEARIRAEREGGEETKGMATALGAAVGTTEMLPVFSFLNKLSTPIKDGMINYVRRAAVTGGAEGAQEAAAQLAQNLIAKGLYKPEQALIEGVGEEAAYGAGVGALIQGITDMAIGRRARGAAPAPTEAPPAEPPPAAPVLADAAAMSYADRAKEIAMLRMQEQTDETKARIDELTEANLQEIMRQVRGPVAAEDVKTLEEQIQQQAQIQGEFREMAEPPTGAVPIPGGEFAGPVAPEPEFPTTFTKDVLDRTGLRPQSGFYKELLNKDLTKEEDQTAVADVLARIRANPNLSESTKSAVETVANQAFGALSTQAEMFTAKGKVEPEILLREATEINKDVLDVLKIKGKKAEETLSGKDITNPEDAKVVKAALEDYANQPNRSDDSISAIEAFLARPEFTATEEAVDVREPTETRELIPGAVEPSVRAPSKRRAAAAEPRAPVERGLVAPSEDVGLPAVGETTEQRALAERQLGEYFVEGKSIPKALELLGYDLYAGNRPKSAKAAYESLPREQKDIVNQERAKFSRQEESSEQFLKKDRERQIAERGGRTTRYREAPEGTKGNTKESVQKFVDMMKAEWTNAPKITVVQSINELPDYIQADIARDNVNPQGAFDPRTEGVFIVADNINNKNEVILTVAHESIGHFGLRSILGKNYAKVMDNIYNSNSEIRKRADAKIAGTDLNKQIAVEEALAEMSETDARLTPKEARQTKGAIERIKNFIRQFLVRVGYAKKISDADVDGLLEQARDYVVSGRGRRAPGKAEVTPGAVYQGRIRDLASWSPKRIDNLLSAWAYTNDVNDTKAYAGFVNPREFLGGTSTYEYRKDVLEKEKRPLDKEGLAGEIQPIFLSTEIDTVQSGRSQIIGHEGRHRMMALRDAGIERVPIVILNGYSGQRMTNAKPMDSLWLSAEKGIGEAGFFVDNLVPISYAYKEQLKETFGEPRAEVVYRAQERVLTPEGERAKAVVDKMEGISNAKSKQPQMSTMEKARAFLFDPTLRTNAIDKLRVKVAYKGAAVERKLQDAYNGALRDALGDIRPDVFMTAAEHSDTLAVAVMKQGGLKLDKNIGWVAEPGKASLTGVVDKIKALGTKLGDQNLAFKLANDAFIARRANTLKNKDIVDASLLPSQDKIDAGLEAFKEFPELEQAFQEFTDFKNGLIDAMVEGGRLSKEDAQSWKDAADYVPWNRIKDYEEGIQNSPQSYFKGLTNLKSMKKIKGGTEDEINNIFDNMVGLSFWMTNSAIRNHAAVKLTDAFVKNDLGARQVRPGQPGVDPNKTIYIYRDGKPEVYEFDSMYDVYAFKGVESIGGPLLESFAALSNFLRKTTTATPQFAVSQLFQDSYRAMVMSGVKSPFKVASNVLSGYISAYKGDPTTQQLESMGIVGMYDLMPGRAREEIEREFGIKQRSTLNKALNFMESFSIASDAALRKAVFERTLEETKSEQFPEGDVLLARYRAQEVINFKRQGVNRTVGIMRQMIPFMNAYIQGMDVFYRSMTGRGIAAEERTVAAKLFWKTGAKLATLSLIYAMLVGDDDEYEGLRDYEKDKNFIIPGTGLKVPVAPEVGFLFKVIPERVYNYISSQGTATPQDATALRKALGTAAFDAFTGPNLTPQAIKPAFEVAVNYSFFTGAPIVGRGLEKVEPAQQFTQTTSELAKMLGGLSNVSPMKIDYLLRGYTGIAGGTLLDTTSMVFTNGPDRSLYQLPGFKTFMYDKIPGGYKEQYYDFREKVDRVASTVNALKAQGRADELQDYLTDERMQLLAFRRTMNRIDQQLENVRRYKKIVGADPSMSGAEKQRILDELEKSENEMLQAYNIPAMRKAAGL